MTNHKDFTEPVAQELIELLQDVGRITGQPSTAEKLIEGIRHAND